MTAREERRLKAQAWSMACHHVFRKVPTEPGLEDGYRELLREGTVITPQVAGIFQLAYTAVREMLTQGASAKDAYDCLIGDLA